MSNAEVVSRTEHEQALADRDDRIAELEYTLEKLQRMLFGSRSERRAANVETGAVQGHLFEDGDVGPPATAEDQPGEEEARSRKRRGPRFSADVERVKVEQTLADEDRICACGKELRSIGVDKSEKLEFIPAKVRVVEIHRHRYACPCCKEAGVTAAPTYPTAFPKSAITDETRAHFVVQKFVDHLPYYRQAQMLSRNGIELADATIGRYGIEAADLLTPIVWAMIGELIAADYLQVDETSLKVLKGERSKPGAQIAYLWTYGIPWSTVVFEYQPSRAGEHPSAFLEDFQGILQNDRYVGYNSLRRREDIVDVACWAHARRKFVDAEKTAGRRVKSVLKQIRKLYAVERTAREERLSSEKRKQLRRAQSKPVLDALVKELQGYAVTTRPSTPFGKAIEYVLANWAELIVYLDHGQVEIDTNLLENSIRPVALGRKNYLFAGSPTGAEAAATLYSITETCRRIEVNPYDYLVDVFRQRAAAEPTVEHFRSLTPVRWKAANAL